jgi:predicted amidophosphoribosyltransferase
VSRWHREHPEYEEMGWDPPDFRAAADMERKRQKEEGLYACVTCGENAPRFGARCERCKRNMEEDRLERESGR